MKREPGWYWVLIGGQGSVPVVARWTGHAWLHGFGAVSARVRKVLSWRLTPPGVCVPLPLPLNRVLLEDPGKSYREELRIVRVNHATGDVIVTRGKW